MELWADLPKELALLDRLIGAASLTGRGRCKTRARPTAIPIPVFGTHSWILVHGSRGAQGSGPKHALGLPKTPGPPVCVREASPFARSRQPPLHRDPWLAYDRYIMRQ